MKRLLSDGQSAASYTFSDAFTIPVVVSVPHCGEWIPEDVASVLVPSDEVRHEMLQDVDRFTDGLWADAGLKGAAWIAAKAHRYVVDLNRDARDVSPRVVRGAPQTPVSPSYGDRGVVWRWTTRATPVWTRKLEPSEFDQRIERYHAPYHDKLRELLDAVRSQFGWVLLLDGHSMPSAGRAGHSDEGKRRADFVPGDVQGTSCAPEITAHLEALLREQGFTVATNSPYSGGHITRHYADPAAGVHAIQLEANRALYMDETSCDANTAGIGQLATVLGNLIPQLAATVERLEAKTVNTL